ncbi:cadmium resistance protein CadD (predicted permease) [Actinokineospora baliensis]|uniref:cadmium resistance transporter n=1 Tax=Actinokineospora baliensis TaxID=547056 RepID=UPI001958D50B|nr:cadmium resistance transporter [Actinokineospora baliensis]MBM7774487.1 cadmium resistance protein CadD (predicted permease) [Actinokineospora baliensis]
MNVGVIGQAVVLFAVTNIDDILILALFFAHGTGRRATRDIALGQYLGFAGILALAIAAALGATFLPDAAIPYLGLLPLALGVKAAIQLWRHRDDTPAATSPTILAVATVTFANGGDNIGVYVPVFATAGMSTAIYVAVFLALVAVWVAAGRYLATRPTIAKGLSRWGHILLPIVLIALGLLILIEGGAFGL